MINYEFKVKQDEKYPAHSAILLFINQSRIKEDSGKLTKKYNLHFPEVIRTRLLSTTNKEIKYYRTDSKPELVIISKYNPDKKFNNDFFRNYLAGISTYLNTEGIKNLYLATPEIKDVQKYFKDEEYLLQSCLEGLVLGSYKFEKYKSKPETDNSISVHLDGEKKSLVALITKAKILTESIFYARDLSNEPSGFLTPDEFAKRISKDLKRYKVSMEIFDEKELLRRKMNAIYAVGKGSAHPPRLINMHYKPARKKMKVCLIGKGVTFDSGGISIKPGKDMGEMKADMSGGAVVAAVVMTAARLKLPVEIIGLIPAVENMPSGSSLKPGDIIISGSGQSIEVIDTDAEGRLILSEALHYAKEHKPDVIIDIATLTGSAVVALGDATAGLYSNNDELAKNLYDAGQKTFERVWRMPIWEEYDELIKSDVADMKNLGTRWGGNISAAKFLQRFTDENIPWAHLDIAGPAMPHDLTNYTKKYMTGFGVRLLVEYLQSIS